MSDPLSGLYNRRGLFEKAEGICREGMQNGSLSAILIDIDFFKEVNDLYGHHIGDEAIRAIAREAQTDDAILGRLGGDEFSILLPKLSLSDAVSCAEALRLKVCEAVTRANMRFVETKTPEQQATPGPPLFPLDIP